MRFNDRPADRKAQPSATNVVRPSPEKPVEHTKLLPFRNNRPAVTHIDLQRVIIATTSISIGESGGVYFNAFSMRLMKTCSRSTSSIAANGTSEASLV